MICFSESFNLLCDTYVENVSKFFARSARIVRDDEPSVSEAVRDAGGIYNGADEDAVDDAVVLHSYPDSS